MSTTTEGAVATETDEITRAPSRHVGLALLALAMGGFAIGTCEFASMGLLPSVAHSVGISIPEGGNVISAYALGVVVGAPLIAVLFAKAPRRAVLIGLMVLFALGNAATALAPTYLPLLAARFHASQVGSVRPGLTLEVDQRACSKHEHDCNDSPSFAHVAVLSWQQTPRPRRARNRRWPGTTIRSSHARPPRCRRRAG